MRNYPRRYRDRVSCLASFTLDYLSVSKAAQEEDRFKQKHEIFIFNIIPRVLATLSGGWFSVVSSCQP